MLDGSLPLQAAIIATLKANAGVRALVGDRVYDIPPPRDPMNPCGPFVSIGPVQPEPDGRDDERGSSIYVQIDCWAEASAKGADHRVTVKKMNAAALAALWGEQVPSPEGWRLHHVWQDGRTQVLDDPDGVTAHGVVPLRCDMSPILGE